MFQYKRLHAGELLFLLSKNGFASITSMKIIKGKLSVCLQAFLWNPGSLQGNELGL